jgi:hypothetical protein
MTYFELAILRQIARGPVWAQSVRNVKPVVVRLIAAGLVVRVAPWPGQCKNMLALTDAGRAAWAVHAPKARLAAQDYRHAYPARK